VTARFGSRLPYLLKVLAAEAPLSIQVHPDATHARDGFARQGSAPAAERTYTDPYAKPELLVAVTPFEALCGFRDPDETAGALAELGVPALAPVIEALRTGPVADRLRLALSRLLSWPQAELPELVTAVTASGQPLAVRLGAHYPGDVGVVVALLLNHVQLAPGQAVFMPAGNVHAYLHGAGVEIMGASDNVLRAGLTHKHIDPAELMRLVRYEVLPDPIVPGTPLGPGLTGWSPPVAEFRLVRAKASGPAESSPSGSTLTDSDAVVLPGGGPRIVACVRGAATLRAGTAALTLSAGRAAFVAAGQPPVEVTGDAEVYQAATGSVD
jgi:mannose-6-phosphate isomerase class I